MLVWLVALQAFAGPALARDVRGVDLHAVGGYPDLVGGEVGAHLGGAHVELGASDLLYVQQAFVRGGPEWTVASASTARGVRSLLFSPSAEARAFRFGGPEVYGAAALSLGLDGLVPLGKDVYGEARLDGGAVTMFDWGTMPYVRLSVGMAYLSPRRTAGAP